MSERKPILFKGEVYYAPVTKGGGPGKEPKISYEDARDNILRDITSTKKQLQDLGSIYRAPNEIVLCFRMQPEFSAKSYYPASLFEENHAGGTLDEIGSRVWRQNVVEESSAGEMTTVQKLGKLLFVRTTEAGLSQFQATLADSDHKKKFEIDVRKLSGLNLLLPEEQILGFSPEWKEGKIEAVIHPFDIDQKTALDQFISIVDGLGADLKRLQFKQYESGVTFVSLFADKSMVDALSGYNPLRTIHPIELRELPDITRVAPIKGLPKPPKFTRKPSITLGVIDGGYKSGNPYLDRYVESIESVSGKAVEKGLAHGTLVSSASLYGPLNSYANTETLPEPVISVRNFRVLSQENLADVNLFEAIDKIEEIVPANRDISVFNLSFGPRGEILDDNINRFTYSCDLLSSKFNVLFCVAVGNDGDTGLDRIQSPSDIVNGLGVGAFTVHNSKKVHANYSCKGPGREGNKLKPDVVGFGGCERYPTQLLSHLDGYRTYTYGTSFAAPLVAATSAQIIGKSGGQISALVARALTTHTAREASTSAHCNLMGHGALLDDITHMVSCQDKAYTLIYQDEIPSGKYIQYSIPWTSGLGENGSVNFRWTTAVLTNVDPLSSDDYTTTSIQTAFYPNSRKYKFSKGGKTKTIDIDLESALASQLINNGWKIDAFPVSKSGPTPFEAEGELKADLKWDSIDYRRKGIRMNDIKSPMFHVHAIERGSRHKAFKVKFVLILTVHAPKCSTDIYSKIVANYRNLVPLNIKVDNRIRLTL